MRCFALIAFSLAMASLVLNLCRGADLMHAALCAAAVMAGSAIILIHIWKGIVWVLARYLRVREAESTAGTGISAPPTAGGLHGD
jgi:putative Mn2+ efflux pump MntP